MIDLDSTETSLLVCGANGALEQSIVGVNLALLSAPEPAILCAHPGNPLSRSEAVQVHGFAEVPLGTLAIGQELAARLDLDQHQATWQLGMQSVALVRAEALELELTVDAPVAATAEALSAEGYLAERLLYASSSQQLGDLSLAVDGEDYRVRRIQPAPAPGTATLYQIDPGTQVQLSSTGIRTSVDIVVLVDTSRSMGVPDLKDLGGPTGGASKRSSTRMEAMKRALDNLLKERMATPGRLARFALVAFASNCKLVFPPLGGMAELDENTPEQSRAELEQAIGRLQPRGDTDLGRALKFAGELLAKHSAPGNDRLIVLISDGADSANDGDGDGEMLYGVAAPLSLVESLSMQLGVRLHAIGISSPQTFDSFFRALRADKGYAGPAHRSWRPDHRLLEELTQMSGGDPKRLGDADVLLEHFNQLSGGVSHRVSVGEASRTPQLTPAELSQLAQHQARAGVAQRAKQREELSRDIKAIWRHCNDTAERVIELSLLHKGRLVNEALNGQLLWATDVLSRNQFRSWWLEVQQVFSEAHRKKAFSIPGVREIWRGERMSDLWQLRNWMSHNQDLPDRKRDLEKSSKALLKFVGLPELADDDREHWSRLQLELLRELREVGRELAACLEASAQAKAEGRYEPAPPEAAAAETAPSAEPALATGPALLFVSAPPLYPLRLRAPLLPLELA
jgi:Mg-chelatase subunit ChlD